MREVSLQYRRVPRRISLFMGVGGEVFPADADVAMVSVAADAYGYNQVIFLRLL